MPGDPNISRQIRNLEDLRNGARRSIDSLKQQINALERQDREAARLPNAGRVQSKIRDQVRQARRQIDRFNADIKTYERRSYELKRMQR